MLTPDNRASSRSGRDGVAAMLGVRYFAAEAIVRYLPSAMDLAVLKYLAAQPVAASINASSLIEVLHIPPGDVEETVTQLAKEGSIACEQIAGRTFVKLLPQGRRDYNKLQDAEETHTRRCKEELHARTGCSVEAADDLLKQVEQWLASQSFADLVAFLGGANNMLHRVSRELRAALEAVRRNEGTAGPPAMFVRALGYAASAAAYQSLNLKDQRIVVLVDTNVLMDIVSTSRLGQAASDALSQVMNRFPETRFLVANVTLDEFTQQCDVVGQQCAAWEVGATVGAMRRVLDWLANLPQDGSAEANVEEIAQKLKAALNVPDESDVMEEMKIVRRELRSLGTEYFVREDAPPTFRDFKDEKVCQALGIQPLGNPNIPWRPHLVDTTEVVPENEAAEAYEKLRLMPDWRLRGKAIEHHDIQLLLYASRMTEELRETRYVIWTHHTKLSELAERLGVDKQLVLWGPALSSVVSMSPRLLSDYLRLYFIQPTAHDELMHLHRVLTTRIATMREMRPDELLLQLGAALKAGGAREREETQPEPEPDAATRVAVPLEMLQQDGLLDDQEWLDLSIDWSNSLGGHGTQPLRVLRIESTDHWTRGSVVWHFSPHTVTHLDLPWALERSPLSAHAHSRAQWGSAEAQRYLASILPPRMYPAVFINLTHLAEASGMLQLCARKEGLGSLTKDELAKLVMALRIGRDTLAKGLGEIKDLEGCLVVLHTGWSVRFAHANDDASSLIWEGTHPWLLHPWLDGLAVMYLKDRKIAGLAVDTPMADCPMYIARHVVPMRREVSEAAEGVFSQKFDGVSLPSQQPAHEQILGSFNKVFAEGLWIPDDVKRWYSQRQSAVRTSVYITTLSYHLLPDSAPIKIIARVPNQQIAGAAQ